MPGEKHVKRSCPDCGAQLDYLSDCFRGHASALDNFDAVEEHLRSNGVISDEDPLVTEYSRAELDAAGVEPRDGPFISETIMF